MSILLLIVLLFPTVLYPIEVMYALTKNRRIISHPTWRALIDGYTLVVLPIVYLSFIDEGGNDCCSGSATFSPEHRPTMYIWIVWCVGWALVAAATTKLLPPVLEVLLNVSMLFGWILNYVVAFQVNEGLWVVGNIPIGICLTMLLIKRHYLVRGKLTRQVTSRHDILDDDISEATRLSPSPSYSLEGSYWYRSARRLLLSPLLSKYPVLIALMLPLFVLVTALLMLFGQQPDALVLAFTQTYKHGLSQLDHECLNVVCPDDHCLCTVAASGPPEVVRPVRMGVRRGRTIICNRQLMVANAFEEVIAERVPGVHRLIRRYYDRVGDWVQRDRQWFAQPRIAAATYRLMKPAEWFFVLVLYTCTRDPESRIAKQYL